VRQADGDQVGQVRKNFIACTGYPECSNTRELPPDPASAEGLTEQDAEEYCENCGRVMVLKKGRFRAVLRLLRIPGLQDDQADRRNAEEIRCAAR